jgi:hypothetical protein
MCELDPETRILRAVSEAQIIEDFNKYEGIRIERLDDKRVKATFEETFGEGSATGNSVLNVLIAAIRRQKNQRYWDGYKAAEEKAKQETIERLEMLENEIIELTESINQHRITTDAAIQHLATHVSHLALQFTLDHQKTEQESEQ